MKMEEISNYAFISKNERKYAFLYLRFSDSFLKCSESKLFSNAHVIYLFFNFFISDLLIKFSSMNIQSWIPLNFFLYFIFIFILVYCLTFAF